MSKTKEMCKFANGLAEYDLTPAQLAVLVELLESKGNVSTACVKADVSRKTYYNWTGADVFQVALEATKNEIDRRRDLVEDFRTREVEDALYKNATEGKENSIIFYLKNRDPKRWKNDYIQGQEYTQYVQNNNYFLKTEVGDMSNRDLILAAEELAKELNRGTNATNATSNEPERLESGITVEGTVVVEGQSDVTSG